MVCTVTSGNSETSHAKKKLTNPPIQFSSWYIDPMMKLFGRNSSGKTLPQSIIESPHFTTRFIFGPMRVYVAGSPSVYSHTKITDPVKLHQVSMLFAGPKSKVETLSTSLRCAYKTWLPNTRLLWNKQTYQPALGEFEQGSWEMLICWCFGTLKIMTWLLTITALQKNTHLSVAPGLAGTRAAFEDLDAHVVVGWHVIFGIRSDSTEMNIFCGEIYTVSIRIIPQNQSLNLYHFHSLVGLKISPVDG